MALSAAHHTQRVEVSRREVLRAGVPHRISGTSAVVAVEHLVAAMAALIPP
jgi:hypothetical protein